MNKAAEKRLANYETKYRKLAEQIAEVGFISSGSVLQRLTRCANENCRCRADPPQLHGPYFQWTAKIEGRTVTKRLTESEAMLHKDWIANDRKLSALVAKMREVASKAQALILAESAKSRG